MLRPSPDLQVVLVTASLSELSVAKSVLEAEGVAFVVTGEESARMLAAPLLAPLLGERLTGARLLVQREDLEIARALLQPVDPDHQ